MKEHLLIYPPKVYQAATKSDPGLAEAREIKSDLLSTLGKFTHC